MKFINKLAVATAFASAAIAGPAMAAGFDGSTIQYQYRNPNVATTIATQNAVAGTGVEFNDSANYFQVDLSGTGFTAVDTYGGFFAPNSFNGFVLSDVTNNLAAITGVTFLSGGFAGERPTVTFDANNIFVNFANIIQGTAANTAYRYNVTFASGAVPEPATWGMMILGFGMIGAASRSRKVKTTVVFA